MSTLFRESDSPSPRPGERGEASEARRLSLDKGVLGALQSVAFIAALAVAYLAMAYGWEFGLLVPIPAFISYVGCAQG